MACSICDRFGLLRWVLPTAVVLASSLPVAAAAAGIQYDIRPEMTVAYRVTIVADKPAEKDTMSGVIAFTGYVAATVFAGLFILAILWRMWRRAVQRRS